jgi:hypothetical protein
VGAEISTSNLPNTVPAAAISSDRRRCAVM